MSKKKKSSSVSEQKSIISRYILCVAELWDSVVHRQRHKANVLLIWQTACECIYDSLNKPAVLTDPFQHRARVQHAAVWKESVSFFGCYARHKLISAVVSCFTQTNSLSRTWTTVHIYWRLSYFRLRLTLGVTCMSGTLILSVPSFTMRTSI